MAAWRKLYRPGSCTAVGENPVLPSAVGANQEIFMSLGPVKNTEVRCTGNGWGAPPTRAPTAATAPGTPEPTGGTGPGRAVNGVAPGGTAPGGGRPAWRMPAPRLA